MSITRDTKPHVIVIENVNDDGTVDWLIEHNDLCDIEKFEWNSQPCEAFNCGVQHDLDAVGLDSLLLMLDIDQADLKPGRYPVIGVYEFNSYTREGDFWYEPVPAEWKDGEPPQEQA